MANFTLELKKELLANGFETREEELSALSGFLRTSGARIERDGRTGVAITTETELTAEYFLSLIEKIYAVPFAVVHADLDQFSKRAKFVFECIGEGSERIAIDAGLTKEELPPAESIQEAQRRAFLIGVFLGSGSCTIPSAGSRTGYHLRMDFQDKSLARAAEELLYSIGMAPKFIERRETAVVYIQNREGISDFFYVMGASKALSKLERIADERERKNRQNRLDNCLYGNLGKTFDSAYAQCEQIKLIRASSEWEKLDEELKRAALLRMEYPEMSYRELAEKLSITKSSLSRRLKHLSSIAKRITEKRL